MKSAPILFQLEEYLNNETLHSSDPGVIQMAQEEYPPRPITLRQFLEIVAHSVPQEYMDLPVQLEGCDCYGYANGEYTIEERFDPRSEKNIKTIVLSRFHSFEERQM